jgi:hypothetical protein
MLCRLVLNLRFRDREPFYVMRSFVMFDCDVRVTCEVRDHGKGEVSSAVVQVLLVCAKVLLQNI